MATKEFTREELESRNRREDAAIIIDNVVYDVTSFLEDHPGGAEVLLDNAGRDASKCFHDVGHSDDALQWRERFRVGELVEADRRPVPRRDPVGVADAEPLSLAGMLSACAPPLAMAVLAWFLYSYLF